MCNGCGTCLQSCSKGAISMKVDEEGFVYPVIDLDKCNSCNICRKSCPVLNNKKKEFSPLCYAAKNKNVEIQKNSSSGGVFSVLADYVFNKKGIVYGVVLDGNYVTKHIRVINSIGLEKIRGSKYTQSNSFEVFMDVKKDLEDFMVAQMRELDAEFGLPFIEQDLKSSAYKKQKREAREAKKANKKKGK